MNIADNGANIFVRPSEQNEGVELARICFEAFANFNSSVSQPLEEFGEGGEATVREIFDHMVAHKNFRSFVATSPDGKLIGSNHLDLRDEWAAVGPISVDPASWEKGVGKALMLAVIKEAEKEGFGCICLQQVSANAKSYALYASLGFVPKETCIYLKGHAVDVSLTSSNIIRPMLSSDVDACSALYQEAFGISRRTDIRECAEAAKPKGWVVEATGQILAFTTGLNLTGFILARSRAAFKELLVGTSRELRSGPEPHLHLPATGVYFDVLEWALTVAKLKVVRQTTLMVRGDGYTGVPRPEDLDRWPFVYCPSIGY